MGYYLHTVVEIKKENVWVGLEECPKELKLRNDSIFAFLTDARDSFNTKGFKLKGFPDDISEKAKKEFEDDLDLLSKSYLTLKELDDADKKDLYTHKCRILSAFWEKFKELGGQLPSRMEVENVEVKSFYDAMKLSFCPEVIIKWQLSEEEIKKTIIYRGIEALKEIAKQNNIENYEDIRIVFCFDN